MGSKFKIPLSQEHVDFDKISRKFIRLINQPAELQIQNFEYLMERTFGSYCCAVNSATSGLHLAMITLGVGPGDYVICSAFTFVASANPVLYQRATPVFIDCEIEGWNMDPQLLQDALKSMSEKGIKPKAIILPHIYGMPAKIDDLLSIANKYKVPIIEDAAQSLGSTYKNKFLGTIGEMGVISFNNNKILPLFGGGLLMSSNVELINKARYYSRQAKCNKPYYFHKDVGYNYLISPIQASLGICLWPNLFDRVKRRKKIYERYREYLNVNPDIIFQKEASNDHQSNRWLTALSFQGEIGNRLVNHVQRKLNEIRVESKRLWKPLFTHPPYAGCETFINGNSRVLFQTGLCLPSSSNLKPTEIECISNLIIKSLN